jgi:hypothetical protein
VPVAVDPPEPAEEFEPWPQPLMSDAQNNRIAEHAIAKGREKRRGRICAFANKVNMPAAPKSAPKIQRILRDESRSKGMLIGKSSDRAVVVTETVAVAAAPPLTVTLDGDTEQAGPAGATLHFSATVPVKPPLPANEIG